jgi:hypothetical protein
VVRTVLHEHDEESTYDSADDELYLTPVVIGKVTNTSEWTEQIDMSATNVTLKLDTEANANVLPYTIYQKINTPLQPTRSILKGIGQGHAGSTTRQDSNRV